MGWLEEELPDPIREPIPDGNLSHVVPKAVSAIDPTGEKARKRTGVNSTLLRSQGEDEDPEVPLLVYSSNESHRNTKRNPFFKYLQTQRLANMTTNRSNVYAVWVTVGYFEMVPWDPDGDGNADFDAAHPEGMALGPELGSDTGEIRRNRAFYVLDRSIPVGFDPGQNLNVDKTILLRRVLD